jgi:predicted  nucleic acid-binding Zn-ribbon protein
MRIYCFQQLRVKSTHPKCGFAWRTGIITLVGILMCVFVAGCGSGLSDADKQTVNDLASNARDIIDRDAKTKERKAVLNRQLQSILDEERSLATNVQQLQDIKAPTPDQRKELAVAKEQWSAFRQQMRQRLNDLGSRIAEVDREQKAISDERIALQASAKAEADKLNQHK